MVLYACASARCFTRARRRKPPAASVLICIYFEHGGVNALCTHECVLRCTRGERNLNFWLKTRKCLEKKQFRSRNIFMDWIICCTFEECGAKRLSFALAGHLKSSDKEKILTWFMNGWCALKYWREREKRSKSARRSRNQRGDTALLRVVIHDFQLKQLSGADRFPSLRDG
jgi:hypothetical protein